jgi:hypothetical protein
LRQGPSRSMRLVMAISPTFSVFMPVSCGDPPSP